MHILLASFNLLFRKFRGENDALASASDTVSVIAALSALFRFVLVVLGGWMFGGVERGSIFPPRAEDVGEQGLRLNRYFPFGVPFGEDCAYFNHFIRMPIWKNNQ